MAYIKRTVMIEETFYERLRREAFYNRREIRAVLNEILAAWDKANPEPSRRPAAVKLRESREQFDRERILDAMEQSKNNREQAAALLGISRMTLFNQMKKHGLTFPFSRK